MMAHFPYTQIWVYFFVVPVSQQRAEGEIFRLLHNLTLGSAIRNLTARRSPQEIVDALAHVIRATPLWVLAIWPASRLTEEPENIDRIAYYGRNVPPAFRRQYREMLLQHGPSILARHAATAPPPFTITEARSRLQPMPDDQWVFDLLIEHGIRDGLYCPYGNWMVVYAASTVLKGKQGLGADVRYALDALGKIAVNQLQAMTRPKQKSKRALSQRELAVLRLLSDGLSAPAIAARENISVHTVEVHIKHIRRKLGAKTIAQAVGMVTKRRLI